MYGSTCNTPSKHHHASIIRNECTVTFSRTKEVSERAESAERISGPQRDKQWLLLHTGQCERKHEAKILPVREWSDDQARAVPQVLISILDGGGHHPHHDRLILLTTLISLPITAAMNDACQHGCTGTPRYTKYLVVNSDRQQTNFVLQTSLEEELNPEHVPVEIIASSLGRIMLCLKLTFAAVPATRSRWHPLRSSAPGSSQHHGRVHPSPPVHLWAPMQCTT